MSGYPGSKGGSGVAEKIISEMPLHDVYAEGFAGMAAVYKKKRRAPRSILFEMSPAVVTALLQDIPHDEAKSLFPGERVYLVGTDTVVCGDVMDSIPTRHIFSIPSTLLYLDPPYLASTRTHKSLYEHEFRTEVEHLRLLTMIKSLTCMVMISGYRSDLYMDVLKGWRHIHFPAGTRGGVREEYLWMNFPSPKELHDPRFVGKDYRQRENLKRKKCRWVKRIQNMDPAERCAMSEALYAALTTKGGGT